MQQRFGQNRADILRQRQELIPQARQLAYEQVDALQPSDAIEAERKQAWLSQIDELTLEELVTFTVYSALARPTLDYKTRRVAELIGASDSDEHTVEYRFGNGKLQDGYYDIIPEVRTLPTTPTIAIRRRHRLIAILFLGRHGHTA